MHNRDVILPIGVVESANDVGVLHRVPSFGLVLVLLLPVMMVVVVPLPPLSLDELAYVRMGHGIIILPAKSIGGGGRGGGQRVQLRSRHNV